MLACVCVCVSLVSGTQLESVIANDDTFNIKIDQNQKKHTPRRVRVVRIYSA